MLLASCNGNIDPENGGNGGVGIVANQLTISGEVSCDIIGGNGGNGGDGVGGVNGIVLGDRGNGTYYCEAWYQYNSSYSKDDAHYGYEYRGYNGSAGGNGGNGGR